MPRGSTFERCALISGLLTREQLDEAWSLVSAPGASAATDAPSDDTLLAEKLVELGWLNVWQVKQLMDGRTKFTLGPYRIIDSLGRGGMGQVFKGEHSILGRVVAIKVLPLAKSTPDAVVRFMREIRNQGMLDHENLLHALDAGADGNVYYLVTEYVPGSDLRKLVRTQGPLDMEAAAGIISQVAAGLQYAHAHGLIHRDVKPGNVLVTPEGRAILSDLGLASSDRIDPSEDPRAGRIVGTADYLSPDQIMNPLEPRPAWDIYSLGCTLYYAVTGKVPFPSATTTAEKVRAQCEWQPLDPKLLNPSLEPAFVEVIADMMAKDPSRRIRTAGAVIDRLAPWVGLTVIEGPKADFPTPPPLSSQWSQVVLPEAVASSSFEAELQETPSGPSIFGQWFSARNGQRVDFSDSVAPPPPPLHRPAIPSQLVWPLFLAMIPLSLIGIVTLIWAVVRLLF